MPPNAKKHLKAVLNGEATGAAPEAPKRGPGRPSNAEKAARHEAAKRQAGASPEQWEILEFAAAQLALMANAWCKRAIPNYPDGWEKFQAQATIAMVRKYGELAARVSVEAQFVVAFAGPIVMSLAPQVEFKPNLPNGLVPPRPTHMPEADVPPDAPEGKTLGAVMEEVAKDGKVPA